MMVEDRVRSACNTFKVAKTSVIQQAHCKCGIVRVVRDVLERWA